MHFCETNIPFTEAVKKRFFFTYFHILYLYIFVKVVTNMLHVSKYHVEKTPKRTRQNCISALQVHLGGTGPSSQKNIWIQMKKNTQIRLWKYSYTFKSTNTNIQILSCVTNIPFGHLLQAKSKSPFHQENLTPSSLRKVSVKKNVALPQRARDYLTKT